MENFLTLVFARKEPKLRSRNFLSFKELGFPRNERIVKDLPLSFKIVGSSATPHTARGHLDEPGLVLFQPESEEDKIGSLEADSLRTS